ncbi:MAG TPA: IS1182 family transposase [Actinomycetota bacterium]|nr:IS1182 family transposase [Actinomycetota bacterium]
MSLHAREPDPIPEETARVARAAFPGGNLYVRMREAFDTIYSDEDFADLFPTRGQPAEAPWRLALVTIFQFAEHLSDRAAADAVRGRIDWKYALSLEVTDPGFDHTVLSEFRTRLLLGGAERRLLDLLVACARDRGLLKARGRQRTDSTHVLAAVRALNRVELVTETMRHALTVLADVAPDWLRAHGRPEWATRYERRPEDDGLPSKQAERQALAETIGRDGLELLIAVDADEAPAWLRDLPALRVLRSVWIQNYLMTETVLRWRTEKEGLPPAARFISSPYDPDAHYARKHATSWVGYKVHLTETCEDDTPNLITNVATAPGPVADGAMTPDIHQELAERDLLPGLHVVDTGYLDAELLVTTPAQFGVDLLGPTRKDYHWQARDGQGFDAQGFTIDWDDEQATCPAGRTSISWTPAVDKRRNQVVKIKFSTKDCGPCPHRAQCIRSRKASPRRTITVRPQDQYEALRAAREREKTDAYAEEYARRAGVEGTLSQAVRRCGLRRSRYVGLARTHLGHVLTATAVNFVRIGEWLAGTPRAKTRHPPFATVLAPAAAA